MDNPTPKMDASAATAVGGALRRRPAAPVPSRRAKDPFRLGQRIRRGSTTGQEGDEWIPLTAEDLVYPEEGDLVSDGYPHSVFLAPTGDALRRHLEKRPATLVTSNVTLVLGDGRNSAPDVAVIEGDVDTSEIERGIHLRAVGGRLVFVLEAVSTSEKEIEDKDLKKNVKRYAQEEVKEYFTVYPVRERRVKNLVGRRLRKGRLKKGYAKIPPDAQGRVYSKQLDLFFQIDASTQELVAFDAKSGERLLISDEEEAGRKAAERRAAEEAAQREAAEREREAAERRAGEEAAARQKAEAELEKKTKAHLEALAELERLKPRFPHEDDS